MEERKKVKVLVITALVVAIGALTIGYASLSHILHVVNNERVTSNLSGRWENSFENISSPIVTGAAQAGNLDFNSTTMVMYNVVLHLPGDSVTYTFDVTNYGDFDAKMILVQKFYPTFTGSGLYKEFDEKLVKENYEFIVSYADDTPILVDDLLKHGETKKIKVKVGYKVTDLGLDALPESKVDIKGLGMQIVFEQAE